MAWDGLSRDNCEEYNSGFGHDDHVFPSSETFLSKDDRMVISLSLCVSLPLSLSLCLSDSASVSLSVCFSLSLLCLSVSLSLSVSVSVCLSVSLSVSVVFPVVLLCLRSQHSLLMLHSECYIIIIEPVLPTSKISVQKKDPPG